MSEISEYETRITAALERIGRAVVATQEQDQTGGIAAEEMVEQMGQLQDALETEREANAQLEERVKAIHEKQESHVAMLESEVENLRAQVMSHDGDVQKLRAVNAQLRANNTSLRDANTAGLPDPELVNAALAAELAALKAQREVDVTELDAIRGELGVLIAAATKQEGA